MSRREFSARRELCPPGSPRADEVFARVGAGVLTWGIQRGAGFEVLPVALGGVHVVVGWRGHGLHAPVRIVEVFRGDERIGFTYATMPGHPENVARTAASSSPCAPTHARARGGCASALRWHAWRRTPPPGGISPPRRDSQSEPALERARGVEKRAF